MNIRKIKKNLKKISFIALLILISSCSNVTAQRYLSKKYSDKVDYKKADFKDLNNWDMSDQLISFDTFKKSCAKIVDENKPEYTNWTNICHKVIAAKIETKDQAKTFFEQNFTPYQVIYKNKDTGTFTGYYEPTIKGSLVKTLQYTVPIYRTPNDLVKQPKGDDN